MNEWVPAATIIVPNWNGSNLLPRCLAALKAQTFRGFETLVVDNGSRDGSPEQAARQFPETKIIRLTHNTGFAHACNVGIEASGTPYIVLLNNDTEVRPDWLERLVAAIEAAPRDVACVSSRMLQLDHPALIDDAGDYLTWRGGAFKRGHGQPKERFEENGEVMLPCAGAALYRREVLERLGGFDERFFAYLEDVDLGLRIRISGYRCLYAADAEVLHQGHGSAIPSDRYVFLTTRNRTLLFIKNIPVGLLLRRLPALAYGWLFFLVVHRGQWNYWRGTLAVLKQVGHVSRSRRRQRRLTRLSSTEIDSLLDNPWPEVGLGTLLLREFRRLRRVRP